MIPQKQISMKYIFEECQNIFDSDRPAFLSLLEEHIDLDSLIPYSFCHRYYASTGRNHVYPLTAMLWVLIIQKLFSISTDSLLLIFLNYSRELRTFCGFTKVPDASKITRFKRDFLLNLKQVFEKLVDLTEPICQEIDAEKASITIFDTSGVEAWVKENNPKYADRIIKQLKNYAKAHQFDPNYDPCKAAYVSMPSHAFANEQIKQLYANGHFCYAYKFGIVTNGLGIVRHLDLYGEDFFQNHPKIERFKKSKSPDEDKSVGDSRLLIPTHQDYFRLHPLIDPKTFSGDATFDAINLYKELLTGDTFGENKHFLKAFISLNKRSSVSSFLS